MFANMVSRISLVFGALKHLADIPPLLFRLTLAYGFYGPAIQKLQNPGNVAQWFEGLGYPFPLVSAYLAGYTEALGVLLLTIGLATRLISIPLMFVMIVAITTVHFKNGFACGDNGFEIPFYYLLMLFSLFVSGAGRISIDAWFSKKYSRAAP
ncbi:MAG: DoxX family protein [Bdellovibrionales bacterium]|nr:DoxX family protein [Bdellovibrionales bacterium]